MDLSKYNNRQVVLVDEKDNELGVAGLIEAHREPTQRHRAFSLWLKRRVKGGVEVLLQKRAQTKPIFAGLWANSCCYNLAPKEEYVERAVKRVKEELGIKDLEKNKLQKLYQFNYVASDKNGWGENEVDQVLVGEWEGGCCLNPDEVEEVRWMGWEELKREVELKPDEFAPWLKIMLKDGRVEKWVKTND